MMFDNTKYKKIEEKYNDLFEKYNELNNMVINLNKEIVDLKNGLNKYVSQTMLYKENTNDVDYNDPLYDEVVNFAIKTGVISASLIQRKYRLGYNRAARLIDLLEEKGVIGPQKGSKPREILIKEYDKK